ncbi:uncharacterized protein LOC128972837 [Indicator indicator]|uniref:uncharacterized protein LOC128972837 n=1 Tax=Indicator indicator TaxID=1002788 RepID=UPI0023E01750|nr:uncharacterized protein LOC128972837 [Indicator indicator]
MRVSKRVQLPEPLPPPPFPTHSAGKTQETSNSSTTSASDNPQRKNKRQKVGVKKRARAQRRRGGGGVLPANSYWGPGTPTRAGGSLLTPACTAPRNSGVEKRRRSSPGPGLPPRYPGPRPESGAGAAPPGCARLHGEEPLRTAPLPPKLLREPRSPGAFPPENNAHQPKSQPASPLLRTGLAQRGLRAGRGPRPGGGSGAALPSPLLSAALRSAASPRRELAGPSPPPRDKLSNCERPSGPPRAPAAPRNFTGKLQDRLSAGRPPCPGRFVSFSPHRSRPAEEIGSSGRLPRPAFPSPARPLFPAPPAAPPPRPSRHRPPAAQRSAGQRLGLPRVLPAELPAMGKYCTEIYGALQR